LISRRSGPYGISTVLTPPRVLVVDDERYVRGLLSELLAVWGCEADLAASGTEGLRLFKEKSYDLVLTDYVMPGGSGLELVENVRSSDAAVGVIMLTASGADLDSHGRRLGFKLLRKPLRIDHLEAAVKQALHDRTIEA
jgi:two-component system, OmpR family, response regulator